MFGYMAAGPDPAAMSCAEIMKGYETNQRLAKTRSGKHRKNSLERVKELEPFYNQCMDVGLPYKAPDQDTAEVIAKIYQDGGSYQQTPPIPGAMSNAVYRGPAPASAFSLAPGSTMGSAVGIVVLIAAVGGLLWLVKKSVKKNG